MTGPAPAPATATATVRSMIRKRLPVAGPLLDLELLRTFLAVIDHGGFTRASLALNRTQAAVSLQIRRLEELSDAALILRSQKNLELTGEGEALAHYARRLLALNDEALAAVRPHCLAGIVRLGAMEHYAVHILPPLLAEFCSDHPQVRIELRTDLSPVMQANLGTTLDLVLGVNRADASNGVILQRQRALWVSSADHPTHLKDPLPVALLPQGALLREWAIAALQRRGLPWHITFVGSSIPAMHAMIAAGLAVGVITTSSLRAGLRQLTPEDGFPLLPHLDITLQSAGDTLSRAAAALRAFLVDRLIESAAPSPPA